MKNLYTLLTDKPSRLWLYSDGVYALHQIPTTLFKMQNLYITSSEEIKEGDWMYYKHFGEDIVTKYNTWGGQNTNVNEHKDYYKKIILTTDQDLINDGIQPIDDDFLEWYINNPSCEEVKVKKEFDEDWDEGDGAYGIDYYKIIIPKEEPKQRIDMSKYIIGIDPYDDMETLKETKTNLEKLPFPELIKEFEEYYKKVPLVEESKLDLNSLSDSLDTALKNETKESLTEWLKNERKETTLEEVAERLYLSDKNNQLLYGHSEELQLAYKAGIFDGAKWSQEGSYSKEDMLLFAKFVYTDDGSCVDNDGNVKKETLEQFKKK